LYKPTENPQKIESLQQIVIILTCRYADVQLVVSLRISTVSQILTNNKQKKEFSVIVIFKSFKDATDASHRLIKIDKMLMKRRKI